MSWQARNREGIYRGGREEWRAEIYGKWEGQNPRWLITLQHLILTCQFSENLLYPMLLDFVSKLSIFSASYIFLIPNFIVLSCRFII